MEALRKVLKNLNLDCSLAVDALQNLYLSLPAEDFKRLRGFRGRSEEELRAFLKTLALHFTQNQVRDQHLTRLPQAAGLDFESVPERKALSEAEMRALIIDWESIMSPEDREKLRIICDNEGILKIGQTKSLG